MSILAITHQNRAKSIKNTLGIKSAAGFLRNRDVSLQEALWILVGPNCKVR